MGGGDTHSPSSILRCSAGPCGIETGFAGLEGDSQGLSGYGRPGLLLGVSGHLEVEAPLGGGTEGPALDRSVQQPLAGTVRGARSRPRGQAACVSGPGRGPCRPQRCCRHAVPSGGVFLGTPHTAPPGAGPGDRLRAWRPWVGSARTPFSLAGCCHSKSAACRCVQRGRRGLAGATWWRRGGHRLPATRRTWGLAAAPPTPQPATSTGAQRSAGLSRLRQFPGRGTLRASTRLPSAWT